MVLLNFNKMLHLMPLYRKSKKKKKIAYCIGKCYLEYFLWEKRKNH